MQFIKQETLSFLETNLTTEEEEIILDDKYSTSITKDGQIYLKIQNTGDTIISFINMDADSVKVEYYDIDDNKLWETTKEFVTYVIEDWEEYLLGEYTQIRNGFINLPFYQAGYWKVYINPFGTQTTLGKVAWGRPQQLGDLEWKFTFGYYSSKT